MTTLVYLANLIVREMGETDGRSLLIEGRNLAMLRFPDDTRARVNFETGYLEAKYSSWDQIREAKERLKG